MINLENNAKLVMGVMGAIATIAFGTAIALHCKDKRVAEVKHQGQLTRVKFYIDMIYDIQALINPNWWTIKPHERANAIDAELREYMAAITESLTEAEIERLEKEIGEYVDMKSLQKKPEDE